MGPTRPSPILTESWAAGSAAAFSTHSSPHKQPSSSSSPPSASPSTATSTSSLGRLWRFLRARRCSDLFVLCRRSFEFAWKLCALAVCVLLLALAKFLGGSEGRRREHHKRSTRDASSAPPRSPASAHSFTPSGSFSPSSAPPSGSPNGPRAPVGTGTLSSAHLHPPRASTFYEVLLVSSSASATEIKAAHRRLRRSYHPDKHSAVSGSDRVAKAGLSPAQSAAFFIQIQEAYEVLSDVAERKRYDYALRHRLRYKKLAAGSVEEEPDSPFSTTFSTTASTANHSTTSTANSSYNSSRRSSYDATFPGWQQANGQFTAGQQPQQPKQRRPFHSLATSPYTALPLALFGVFILKPLKSLGFRYRIARIVVQAQEYLLGVLGVRRAARALERAQQWSLIQWLTWAMSGATFMALYIPVRLWCFWAELRRHAWRSAFGRSKAARAAASASASPHEAPTSTATPNASPEPQNGPQPVWFTAGPRTPAPYSGSTSPAASPSSGSSAASRETFSSSVASRTASESSSPSMSASPSASSIEGAEDEVETRGATTAIPMVTVKVTPPPPASATVRSLSESDESSQSDEDDLVPLSAARLKKSEYALSALKKSKSMPFTAQPEWQ